MLVRGLEIWQQVMEKGRTLEWGATNCLYGPEIADIMERFPDSPFQIQVWKDLAIARYKLYDATGMWLRSKGYLHPETYENVLSTAEAYLEEMLVPHYFQRLRDHPGIATPGLKVGRVNYATRNFFGLPQQEQAQAVAEFHRSSLRKPDWFYSLVGGRVFAAENETGGYIIMLAEDY